MFGDDNVNGDLILSIGDQIDGNVAGTDETQQYIVKGLLGSGSFAQVILAERPLSKLPGVAIKVIKAVPECAQQSRVSILSPRSWQLNAKHSTSAHTTHHARSRAPTH